MDARSFAATRSRICVELGEQRVERVDDRPGVLRADVRPNAGVSGRHPGHVPEAAGGQPEQRTVLFRTHSGGVHQRGGHQVRDVGDHGDEAVVVIWGENEHVGAELGDHPLQAIEGIDVRRTGRGQDPDRALEEIGRGPAQADLLGSGHRVPADEAWVVGGLDDGGLDPADVGDDSIAPALRCGEDFTRHPGNGRGRCGDEDDFGLEVVTCLIDDARAQRLGNAFRVRIEATDMPASLTQGESYRSTDEAGPHDERPRARPAVRPGGHRGALGHRGDRHGGFRPWSWWCARGAGPECTGASRPGRRSRRRTATEPPRTRSP